MCDQKIFSPQNINILLSSKQVLNEDKDKYQPHERRLTGFVPFFRNKFPGLFQDFSRTQIDFSRALKFTLTSTIPRSQWQFSLLPSIHFIFLDAFHRFPGLSRTSGLFPGLSSPGKCHNEIPGLSRFSRTRTNPGLIDLIKVIPLKLFYYQTFFETWRNEHS